MNLFCYDLTLDVQSYTWDMEKGSSGPGNVNVKHMSGPLRLSHASDPMQAVYMIRV